ncbi:MAG: hypothetical protein IPP99_18965 [Chitinophagaceae bacterium]|nr:hypothetical protein [Chitinophagaceae bacterium]
MKKNLFFLLFLSLVSLLQQQLFAQGLTNQGNLQVHNGAGLSSSLPFTNSSTATLVNNGSIYLKADVTNHQVAMATGAGTLYIDGSAAQQLTGSATLKTYHLVTDNSSGITLNNDLSVGGNHNFVNGLISSSVTPNYLIYESGATNSGATDSRHVTGWVKKIGSDDFTFPVGDNSFLRTIAISSLSVTAEFNCHYYATTPNIYNLQSPIVKVRAAEYWQLDKVSGGNARVTMTWDHTKIPMDNILLSEIRAGHYTGGNWTDAGGTATGDVATTGSVTSNAISTFSPLTLAYTSFPIPLKLVSFTGWRKGGVSYLHWVSENEQDMSHFSLERSLDGNLFIPVGNTSARNRGIREIYSKDDPFAFNGILYYRLKNIDNDGSFTYSRVIALSDKQSFSTAITVMNPAKTAITLLNRSAPAGSYEYQLFNNTGQQVSEGKIDMTANGAVLIKLPIQIATGYYTLHLQGQLMRFSQQVLIEK